MSIFLSQLGMCKVAKEIKAGSSEKQAVLPFFIYVAGWQAEIQTQDV